MEKKVTFKRIKNDVNGNPRYVCHFLDMDVHGSQAQAEGLVVRVINNLGELVLPNGDFWFPSIDWAQGGPIIEREKATIEWTGEDWMAYIWHDEEFFGPTPLIAAMRCYVADKLGEEINIPEEVSDVANYS